jgi:hypothetical protein
MKTAIVTLSDTGYFHLLEELVDSVHSFKESNSVSICVLDAGMKEEQLKIIKSKVYSVKKAKWDISVNTFKVRGREWLKSMVSRAFLPDYFPEFEKYIWIDADAWINSWFAIDLLKQACENNKLGIVSMADRHTGRVLALKWIFKNISLIKSQNYKHAKASGFSEEICRFVGTQPQLNSGVFSLQKSSPIWKIWQKNCKKSLSKGRIFASEQIAINISVYIDNVPVDILPYYCNWIPNIENIKFDINKNKFVEGFTPNHEIGIVHLAGGLNVGEEDMRFNKNLKLKIHTTSNSFVYKSFRFNKN